VTRRLQGLRTGSGEGAGWCPASEVKMASYLRNALAKQMSKYFKNIQPGSFLPARTSHPRRSVSFIPWISMGWELSPYQLTSYLRAHALYSSHATSLRIGHTHTTLLFHPVATVCTHCETLRGGEEPDWPDIHFVPSTVTDVTTPPQCSLAHPDPHTHTPHQTRSLHLVVFPRGG
jgi:hypothetical protein